MVYNNAIFGRKLWTNQSQTIHLAAPQRYKSQLCTWPGNDFPNGSICCNYPFLDPIFSNKRSAKTIPVTSVPASSELSVSKWAKNKLKIIWNLTARHYKASLGITWLHVTRNSKPGREACHPHINCLPRWDIKSPVQIEWTIHCNLTRVGGSTGRTPRKPVPTSKAQGKGS